MPSVAVRLPRSAADQGSNSTNATRLDPTAATSTCQPWRSRPTRAEPAANASPMPGTTTRNDGATDAVTATSSPSPMMRPPDRAARVTGKGISPESRPRAPRTQGVAA